VKFEQTGRFRSDRAALPDDQFAEFRRVVVDQFIPAAVRHAGEPGSAWPRSLRVKSVRGAPGVWEMTWSFAGPDGRATFEWVTIDAEPAIRWRRVGSHAIFSDP
jgi:putative SOS response-associated peptidase YedK